MYIANPFATKSYENAVVVNHTIFLGNIMGFCYNNGIEHIMSAFVVILVGRFA